MFEFEAFVEPGLFGLAEGSDVRPAFGASNDGANGNREDVREAMELALIAAVVFDGGKMVSNAEVRHGRWRLVDTGRSLSIQTSAPQAQQKISVRSP